MFFKRNQVEEAISRTIGERSHEPSQTLKTQIKRLLDLDRSLKRSTKSRDPERASFAFFDSTPPGRGAEVKFSEANAFALLVGIRMLSHGWPQSFVVSRLRQAHEELVAQHKAILAAAPQPPQQAIGEPGEMVFRYPNSPFLVVVSDEKTDHPDNGSYVRFFKNQEAALRFQMKEVGRSCSWFGLESSARALREHLTSSLPKARGRSA
jgi:hypothetical protein